MRVSRYLREFCSRKSSIRTRRSIAASRERQQLTFRPWLFELLEDRALLAGLSGLLDIGPTGDYTSITAAISSIQSNGLDGPVTLELQSTYVSNIEVFPLVFSNLGTTSTNTITLRPETGATNLSITSADTTAATIDLNGAQYLTIDGRPGGIGSHSGSGVGTASQLTIANTSTAGIALRFINEASYNTIQYTTLRGVNTSATSGVVVFSTTTGLNGNDNNTIDHCEIRDGESSPAKGIYSSGTTTSTTGNNSNNTVSNCNVFNFYSTTSIAAGLFLVGGNTDWTINGNSFYQSSSRSGIVQSVIPIYISNTSGDNFIVSGNFIGGSESNAGGSPWITPGTTLASSFRGISLNVGTNRPSSIQGNVIKNIVWNTDSGAVSPPGIWIGIYLQAGSANIGTLAGNTIGSSSGTGSVSITTSASGGASHGIGSTSAGRVAIANNTIGAITVNGSDTTVSASFNGIYVAAGSNTISNNIVGSTNTANSLNAATSSTSSTAQQVTGIYSSSFASTTITSNAVANLNNNYVGTSGFGQVRGIATVDGQNVITGNSVHNLLSSRTVYGIIDTSTVSGQNVTQNIVHSLANSATAAAANTNVFGISFSGSLGGTNIIARNFVHSLARSNIAGTVSGIQFGVARFTAQNNMVRLGINSDSTSTADRSSVFGISDTSGFPETRNYFHNSVYIAGAQTSGSANSYAFYSTAPSNAAAFRMSVQNNIFVNLRSNSGATSKHYAVHYGGSPVDPTYLTAGGNIFLATGSGGVLGFYDNTSITTLTAWQTATGQDASSAVADPFFVNPVGAANEVDLHLQSSTPAEGGGVPLTDAISGGSTTVADDFDGQNRNALTSHDIGADADSFTSTGDIFAPVISYPLLSSGSTSNRVLADWVVVHDNSGVVAGGANAPRLYYKKSTDADVFGVPNNASGNGWKFVIATCGISCSFTMDYSLINGGSVGVGDTIQYFVVAQDASNNLGANPIGTATTSTNPPVQNVSGRGAVNSFSIVPIFSGVKNVGAGGDYPSLSGVNGLFNAINNAVLMGDVVVNIISDLTETGAVWLNEFNANEYPPANNDTLTIRPDSATMRTISGSVEGVLIGFNGADRVSIDGRFGGGRYFTIRNTNTTSAAITIYFRNDSSNNILRNSVVEGASRFSSVGVIYFSSGTVTGNDNNLITECVVRDLSTSSGVPSNAISSFGSLTAANSGNIVSDSELFNFDSNGIVISDVGNDSWTISDNNIYNVNAATGGVVGVSLSAGGVNVITGNYVHDMLTNSSVSYGIQYAGTGTVTIARNRVTAFSANATTTIMGIFANGGTGSTANIVNNEITLIPAVPLSQSVYGIHDRGSSFGSVVNVLYNSVVLGGAQTGATNSWASYRRSASTHTSRNNIFLNLRSGGTGNHFASGSEVAGGSYTASNNVYAGTGVTEANFMDFSRTSGTPVPMDFNTWQSLVSDLNSQAGVAGTGNFTSAMFVDAANGDLHLVPGGNPLVTGMGIPIPGITTDFDGDPRSTTAPNIGSDERPNSAPTGIGLSPGTASLAELVNTLVDVFLSTILVIDDGIGTNVVSLSGPDSSSFAIVGNLLFLKAGTALDYETKSSYSVTINVDDPTIGGTPDASAVFTLNVTDVDSTVADRRVFYNRAISTIFGDGSGNPINAIDPTKSALLPGETATFANYTNYVHGLNGLIVDVASSGGTPTAADFQFATSNGSSPLTFVELATPATVSVFPNGGVGGSKRVKIEFPNGAIRNTWLRVTMLANGNTDLSSDDVFYFGNAVGDMNIGNTSSPIVVLTNAADTSAVRQNQSTLPNSVGISNIYDLNKDGRVNATDTSIVRQNQTPTGSILLFTAPSPPVIDESEEVVEEVIEEETEATTEEATDSVMSDSVWLDELDGSSARRRAAR